MAKDTSYVILRKVDTGNNEDVFERVGDVTVAQRARATAAIQEFLGGNPTPEQAGFYVAVRAADWRPRLVSIEARPVVTFDETPPGAPRTLASVGETAPVE